jgi:hypothetical protein
MAKRRLETSRLRVILGAVALLLLVLFLAFLVIAPALGFDRLDYRWVTVIVAVCAGLGVGAFGGEASVQGKFPIELLNSQPAAISLGGGIAVFFLALLLLPRALSVQTSADITDLSVIGTVVSDTPPRVMFESHFDGSHVPADRTVFFAAYSDQDCRTELTRGSVDHPAAGLMTLFVRTARSGVLCTRMITTTSGGVVTWQSRPTTIRWND